ncbi:hypothetical protein B0F90DRAFT_276294 [Multifurca ochricompacta]|uniref:Uncharacterized protein n=1 Tax=Multifurca ochricompacta TaxID=376703 RepID=A0AAD4LW68_9AGAM|nr:hypothetical protein B0F90DRAFT_276294 [Multifurca ochricompacta]
MGRRLDGRKRRRGRLECVLQLFTILNLHRLMKWTLAHTDAFESAPAESSSSEAVGLGWGGTADDEDPWGAFEDPRPPPVPIPVTELTSPPTPTPSRTLASPMVRPSRVAALSPSPSPHATPQASPSSRATLPIVPVSASSPAPNTVGMTKEEKAAEIARRKEERRQRIAQLKEQKKNAVGGKV